MKTNERAAKLAPVTHPWHDPPRWRKVPRAHPWAGSSQPAQRDRRRRAIFCEQPFRACGVFDAGFRIVDRVNGQEPSAPRGTRKRVSSISDRRLSPQELTGSPTGSRGVDNMNSFRMLRIDHLDFIGSLAARGPK